MVIMAMINCNYGKCYLWQTYYGKSNYCKCIYSKSIMATNQIKKLIKVQKKKFKKGIKPLAVMKEEFLCSLRLSSDPNRVPSRYNNLQN